MAASQNKIDIAAEKAFAEAVEKKTIGTAPDAPAGKTSKLKIAAPKEETAPQKVAKKSPAKKSPAKKVAKKVAAKKVAAKKVAAKKAVPVKKLAKKSAAKTPKKPAAKTRMVKKAAKSVSTPKKAKKPAATPISTITELKDTIMAKAKTKDFKTTITDAAATAQTQAKTAFAKGTELTSDVTEFHKENLEAVVASGKVLAAGMQDMGREAMADTKTAAETMTADVKKMVAVKSPTELFQLQGEIARRNLDTGIAQTSKNFEAMMKLAGDVFAPISSRASVAAEKIRKAA